MNRTLTIETTLIQGDVKKNMIVENIPRRYSIHAYTAVEREGERGIERDRVRERDRERERKIL